MRLTSSRCAYPCRWRKMAKDEICPDRFPRMGQMSRSGHQAEALGADNGRSPAVYADLLVKVREVVAHGLFGDAQLPRDLCIAGAFAQQAKGFAFALAQGSKHFSRFGWGRRVRGLAGEEIGRAHVCTPVTNAHLVCRLLLTKKNHVYRLNHKTKQSKQQ